MLHYCKVNYIRLLYGGMPSPWKHFEVSLRAPFSFRKGKRFIFQNTDGIVTLVNAGDGSHHLAPDVCNVEAEYAKCRQETLLEDEGPQVLKPSKSQVFTRMINCLRRFHGCLALNH